MTRLETARLAFRDHEPADLEPYCEMESDIEYRWPQIVHPRAELERSFWEAWMPRKEMGLLATVYKPDTTFIGRCGLYPNRDESGLVIPGEAQIAYYLARPYWRRGLATEAAIAFVDYGFNELGLNRMFAGMDAKNIGSIRVAEKAGFKLLYSGEGQGNAWHCFVVSKS